MTTIVRSGPKTQSTSRLIPGSLRRRGAVGRTVIHLVLLLFSLLCILPILLVVSISLTGEGEIIRNGYTLWPQRVSFDAYGYIFRQPAQLLTSYGVTFAVTICGTAASMLVTSMLAYAISRKDNEFANPLSFYVFLTMLFSGGLVPWYILISRTLHMSDTLFSLFVPYLVVPWFVLLMKGFLSTVPMSVIESAKIDGAGEYRIFFGIVLPVAKPGLATVALFMVLMFWNDYWLSLLFIQSSRFVSLQFLLYRIMANIDFLNSAMASQSGMTGNIRDVPNQSARMAMCVLAAGPMLFVFPFFQKYFVRGLTVGAVKG